MDLKFQNSLLLVEKWKNKNDNEVFAKKDAIKNNYFQLQ